MSVWRVPFLMPVRDCLRRSGPRVQIAKTAIAGDHVRAAFFYRVVSAIPIYVPSRDIYHCAPWSITRVGRMKFPTTSPSQGQRH